MSTDHATSVMHGPQLDTPYERLNAEGRAGLEGQAPVRDSSPSDTDLSGKILYFWAVVAVAILIRLVIHWLRS